MNATKRFDIRDNFSGGVVIFQGILNITMNYSVIEGITI